jgi:hypothetical protein
MKKLLIVLPVIALLGSFTFNDFQKKDPCTLMSSDELKELLSLDASQEITVKSEDRTYPFCHYIWKDGKVHFVTKIGTTEIKTEIESEVMVVLVENATEAMYDRSVQVYKDGLEVESLGSKAMWGEKMRQVSVWNGNTLIHVNVKVNDDNSINKEKAMEIAQFILDKL